MNDANINTAELLGQLIMPRLEITKFENDESYRVFINGLIEKKLVGGFCIFGGTIESLPIILDELQSISKKNELPPLLMSCDCEWGLPMRLNKGGTEFPHLMALGKMNDQNGIKQVAQAIGVEMSALGLHWNFAPVADINSNPKNPIINIRAFSGEPDVVAECASSFYEGLESAGIIATAKHFPGHGDTAVDSHHDLPVIDRSPEEFEAVELLPFRHLSKKGIPSIMTGHIAAPQLAQEFGAKPDEKTLPATISPFLTQKLLREHIGYSGLIITDSLEMYGLQKIISNPGEIASRAFTAGADILLMPTDPVAAYNGLKASFDRGNISSEAITRSVARIEILRQKYIQINLPKISVKWTEHEEIAKRSAAGAIDVVGQIQKPFSPSSVFIISQGRESEQKQIELLSNFFAAEFRITVQTETNSDNWGIAPLFIVLGRPRGVLTNESKSESINRKVSELVNQLLSKTIAPIGVAAFGDPYIADEFASLRPDFILKSYSDSMPSLMQALDIFKENK